MRGASPALGIAFAVFERSLFRNSCCKAHASGRVSPLNTFTATLQYGFSALEPTLSRETVHFHFVQHHRHCYERTAVLVKGTALESLSLESLLRVAGNEARYGRLFMLASEAWSHELYWSSLRPGGGGPARGPLAQGIECSFGR